MSAAVSTGTPDSGGSTAETSDLVVPVPSVARQRADVHGIGFERSPATRARWPNFDHATALV
jgi:hypothetical protein